MSTHGDSDTDDTDATSLPPPPTRRRGSVLDDAIMRDMLSTRVAPAEGVEDDEERERMERMYVMLRWSKKYRQALVRDANASWDADAQAAASETSSVPSSSEGGPSSSSTMSNLDMSTRRSSMSTGSFGAGRIFAASELDAALDAMSGVEGDETGDVVPNPTPSSGRLSIDSTLSGPTIPTALASAHRRKPGDRGRHVRFAEEVTTIPHVDLYDDEDTDHDPSSLDGDNPAGSDNILAKRGEASLKPPKAPAVKKLTKALKRAFSREKLGGRTVYAA